MKKNLPVTNNEVTFAVDTNILSTTDLKGAVTYANSDFIDISGFSINELEGKNHNLVRHPDMPPAAFENLWQTIKAGSSWMGIVKNRCKNGNYYWVDAYVTPVFDNGRIIEYQSVRGKPQDASVERAEKMYKTLNAGRTPPCLKKNPLKLKYKILFAIMAAQVISLSIPLFSASVSPVVVLISFIAGISSAAAMTLWLFKPIGTVVEKARAIFNNPIAQNVFTGRNDEAGQINLAFKFLEEESRGIIGRVSDSTKEISHYAKELNDSIDQNNKSISQQHAETDKVATAITEMSSSIHEVAANAQLSADAALRANDETRTSKNVVNHTMSAIQNLAGDVQNTSEVINVLQSNSEQINTVINVINGIAEQTNLLALNAAIEAARAGEQGRGFAVVADEVRTLATRTHDSTKEIQEMIENLQSGTQQAVSAINKSHTQAEESVAKAQEAVDSLNVIAEAVSNINDMSTQIASAVEEQNTVAQEINQNIVTIRELSQTTVEGIEASKNASEHMAQQSVVLNKLATQFWQKQRENSKKNN